MTDTSEVGADDSGGAGKAGPAVDDAAQGAADVAPGGTDKSSLAQALGLYELGRQQRLGLYGIEPKTGEYVPGGIMARARENERKVAEAKAGAVEAQSKAEVEQASFRQKAAEQNLRDYEQKLRDKPYPAFVPTRDTAEETSAVFGVITMLGSLLGNKGRNSGLSALSAMSGMMEGYQKGRADLYQKELADFNTAIADMKRERDEWQKIYSETQRIAQTSVPEAVQNLKLVAAQKGAEAIRAAADSGDINRALKIIEGQDKLFNSLLTSVAKAKEGTGERLKPTAEPAKAMDLRFDGMANMKKILSYKNNKKIEKEWQAAGIKRLLLEPISSDSYVTRAVAQIAKSKLSPEARNLAEDIMRARNAYYLEISGKAVTGNEAMRNFGAVIQPTDSFEDIMRKAKTQLDSTAEKARVALAGYQFPQSYTDRFNELISGDKTEKRIPRTESGAQATVAQKMPEPEKLKTYAEKYFDGDIKEARQYLYNQGYR